MGKCFCLVRKRLVCCIGVREPLSALRHVVKSPQGLLSSGDLPWLKGTASLVESSCPHLEEQSPWRVCSEATDAYEQRCPCLSHVSVLQHCLSSLKADLPKTGLNGPGVLDSARWLK